MKISVSVQSRRRGGHPIVISADGRRLETPPVENLTFYLMLGLFAAAEIIEWPVVLALSAGHFLAERTNRPVLSQLGEALGEA
jgi:hypothetical protein